AYASQPRPRIECLGVGPCLPQIDAAGPAVFGINKLLADEPRHRPKAWRDLAEMLGAGLEVDARRQPILDDCGNHGAHTSQDLESSFASVNFLQRKLFGIDHSLASAGEVERLLLG